MIEPAMYGAIGFMIALLLALMLMPLVHGRAVRLTQRRLDAATPLSLAEIQADKDQMRAEFAMTARRLEIALQQLRNKAAVQAADLGKKTDAYNRMRIELEEKNAALGALQADPEGTSRPSSEHEVRALELALARQQVEAAGASEALGDAAVESRRAELAAAHARADALTRRVGELKEDVTSKLAQISERESTIEALRQSLGEAERNLDSIKQENTVKAKRSALGKLRAEKAAADQQLQEAREAQNLAQRELSDARSAMATSRVAEGEETSILRERVNDVAAEVAKLALVMEGPNGVIGALLAADKMDEKGRHSDDNEAATASLAARVRALQERTHRALA